MKVLKNYWLLLFILLTVIWMLKMYFGFYFPENIYNSFVMLKDFQLTFFLGVLTYKLYTNKKRKEILNQEIKIQKIRKLELEKNHSGRDYVLEQRENEETLNINENKLMML
ncbi:hypothetical protein [Chryseobacterium gambrini]|uniref:hypothetical protein n=2 Tax=Chryseobacterium TaxID=59732 RepID=UPI0022F1AD43|nr:hypothetical protein [Chryseobacterium gambrini]WBV54269.1 hypothetical protein PFY09_08085 [Chryseobacterium gambrini]